MGKGRVVIAGSVNNDFEPLEKLTDRPSDGMGPTGRESGRGWPISRGRVGALQIISVKLQHILKISSDDDLE